MFANYIQGPSLLGTSFMKTELHPNHFWQDVLPLVRLLAANNVTGLDG